MFLKTGVLTENIRLQVIADLIELVLNMKLKIHVNPGLALQGFQRLTLLFCHWVILLYT